MVLGDRIIVVVQKTRSIGESLAGAGGAGVAAQNKVKRGDVRHAIIVRTKKKYQRKDGMVVRFDDNACALIGKNGEPLGTRINGESNRGISPVYNSSDADAIHMPATQLEFEQRGSHMCKMLY